MMQGAASALRSLCRVLDRRRSRQQLYACRGVHIDSQRQEYDGGTSAECILSTAESHEGCGAATPSTRVFALRAAIKATAAGKAHFDSSLDRAGPSSARVQHLIPAARWGQAMSVDRTERSSRRRLEVSTLERLKAQIVQLGLDLPVSWPLLTPVAVSAATLMAAVESSDLRMHCRWLLSQLEARLLDLSFEHDDATVMQAAVVLSAGSNAGMRMLRSQAVLSASLLERADCISAEAAVRLLKAVAMSGTYDEDLFRGLLRRVSRLLPELTLFQLADVAFALAISSRHTEHALMDLCFVHAARLLHHMHLCNETCHPYCLFQLYLVHVSASASGRGDELRAKLEAAMPAADVRGILNVLRRGAEQAQASAARGSRASGSWHLQPADWRGDVSHAVLAVAGPDFARVKLDAGHKNRFKWSHVFPHMDMALHTAPSSAYMFGPVSTTNVSGGPLSLPEEHELQHSLRPSVHAMLRASRGGGNAVAVLSFADWARASTAAARERLVRDALASAAETQAQAFSALQSQKNPP